MPSGLIIGLALAWVLGLLTSLVVLREPRSSEGTIAWVFGLLVMPVLVVPLYWGLGSIHDLRAVEGRTRKVKQRRAAVGARGGGEPAKGDLGALLRLTPHPLQGGNAAELLCDGDAVFAAMEAAIEGARESVLVQFYTIAVDATAERFIEALRRAHRRGVRVCLLYDPLGSHRFERRWVKGLRREGLEVKPFSFGRRSPVRQLKLNFRNHRKVLVVDGREAFFGGFNVADMYRGRHPRLSPWRDTHVRLKGPGTRDLAESFAEDWTAAGGEVPPGIGEFKPAPAGEAVCAVFPTGPSRRGNRATLLVLGLIQGARERLWISTPYLVPNEAVFIALQAAVLRGVEVVILTAAQRDHYASHLAGYYYARELRSVGVTVMRYREGFLHQKAILVDDRWAAIGSMNLDNRSLQLNFEMTVLFVDAATVRSVEAMLRADLARSDESQGEWTGLGETRQLLCCAARLFAPLL